MWIFYILSLLPLFVGACFWIFNENIVFFEWILGTATALILSVIFHMACIAGMTADIETWSGEITKAIYYPEWTETYTVVVTRRVGKHTYTTTERRYRTHYEHWVAETNLNEDHEITEKFYKEIVKNFNNKSVETPYKSGFHSGDKNVYVSYNKTKFIYPITTQRMWENKIKACPSLFSFPSVPSGIPVFEYPSNSNWLKSDRLLGSASSTVDILEFDRMNSRLGPKKKVNVILIGFPSGSDSSIAHHQESKWIGGKKNDLVLCYSASLNKNPQWTYVFGWTENELVKKNLQTILLHNVVNTNILPLIEKEINKNYEIKDWTKFDYLTVEPPIWSYWVFGIVLIVSQTVYWFWANTNDYEKV